MRNWILAVGMAVAIGGAGAAIAQDVIADRRAGLKNAGEQFQAIKAVSDARGDLRPVAAQIDELIAFFRGLPARFPEGSGTGNTRALPAIWSDRAGFEQANANLITQLTALRALAAAGDNAAFPAAFNQTGAACGACHRVNRAR
ncbi:cytochrome c [Roseococcus sp. YIM B11640]|uniref:cytochrome c n=1 Tax=Roseococcus sp. YIM B11640 TaxID=3133973 RepID=UPI003C7C9475